MRTLDWSSLDAAGRREALARPARRIDPRVAGTVRAILDDVRVRGGAAVAEWSERLDGVPPRRVALTSGVVEAARLSLPPADSRALTMAADSAPRARITRAW